ncbi:hypothetical protein V6N13_024219 [Hibiscus sabdariffa]|uniref:Ionotropic glutamate receptor C-terminal domain-containing protein n=1 Tax=Hibiscus sabdariffa TaxID=183260 RepID=A0ABR2BWX9_9ROSI
MGRSNIVPAMLIFCSLALVNCNSETAGGDSLQQVLDSGLGQKDHHITWKMNVSHFKSLTGSKLALTFLDPLGNSTPKAVSVCGLISNQRVMVIICTLTGDEASLTMDDFITKVPTPCGEPVLPKAKLETAYSVLYLIRKNSRKLSCFSAIISSFKDIKFHREDTDMITFNLTSLASHSRNQKLWGIVEMDEASLKTTSAFPIQWTFSEDIGCERALVATDSTGNYRRQQQAFQSAGNVVYRIGVAVRSNITQFLSINNDNMNQKTHVSGFSIDVFEAAARLVPYKFTYKLIPFDGSTDELIKKVAHQAFDAAIGDTVIRTGHNQRVEFSLPYMEPGFMMVTKAKINELNDLWWFLRLFTPWMWIMIAALHVLTGTTVWMIERQYDDGPNFLEAIFFLQRQPTRNIAARIISLAWLFAVLILTQVYTNMLSSMLTKQEPSILDVDSLRLTNSIVGCDGQSQTIFHLVKVLGFKRRNIRIIASFNDYEEALSSGRIKAAFLLTPYAKVLLAKHCAYFTEIKSTHDYDPGGFGFVFPKGSHLAYDISAAILELEENGKLLQLEEQMSDVFYCWRGQFEDASIQSVGPRSFYGVFILCVGTVIIASLIVLMQQLYIRWEGRIHPRVLIEIERICQWRENIEGLLMGRDLWQWLRGRYFPNFSYVSAAILELEESGGIAANARRNDGLF